VRLGLWVLRDHVPESKTFGAGLDHQQEPGLTRKPLPDAPRIYCCRKVRFVGSLCIIFLVTLAAPQVPTSHRGESIVPLGDLFPPNPVVDRLEFRFLLLRICFPHSMMAGRKRGCIPDPGRIIQTSGNDPAAVRTKDQRDHACSVASKSENLATGGRIPKLHCPVVAGRGDPLG
jgi:hypothetical protein